MNKNQSITTGFSAKPKGKLDNAAGTRRVFVINWVLHLNAVKCNLMKLTTRSTSLTFAISIVLLYAHAPEFHVFLDQRLYIAVCMWSAFLERASSSQRLSPPMFPSLSLHHFISVSPLPLCMRAHGWGSWLGFQCLLGIGADYMNMYI